VNPNAADTYRRVTGWERARRSAGGTNGLSLPEHSNVYACDSCIHEMKRGISEGQATLA
jgi:hypothetical protein